MPRSVQKYDHCLQVFVLPPLPPLDLPPLPPITDPKIEEMVFTHPGFFNTPRSYSTSMFLTDGQAVCNYEKLEHVGDALLEAVAVTLAHELFPNFRQGSAAIMRDKLVANSTLAQIARQYGMPDRIRCAPPARHAVKKNEKVAASVFEAYIAGVYYSYLNHKDGDDTTPSSNHPSASQISSSSSVEFVGGDIDDSSSATSPEEVDETSSDEEYFDAEQNSPSSSDTDINPQLSETDELAISLNRLFAQTTRITEVDNADVCDDLGPSSDHVIPPHDDKEDDTVVGSSASSSNAPTSETIRPQRTRAEAYDYLFEWLEKVLTPIAYFALENLKVEDKRINRESNKSTEAPFVVPLHWKEEDIKAQGGKSVLHNRFVEPNLPKYTESSGFVGRPQVQLWTVECCAIDEEGQEWTAEATRTTKQAAANLAAWRVCVAMGVIREDD
ncbi:uncharacterized protein I303_105315 [Kwoniella dejecticola CBS 10117]|uniref:RNase III domain-containing protein n=1 Tax=Kwoniella dejecticola CBS 10117 TaxID=1296121 RepID=A0A1A6A2U4_9TREE|nr:uncharacterized protein I303_05238 [Kwoniella dejecticola CBS 10117]OBR84380.1 hypothetical protein I303_05238 [Kwoniella dejecticola CBS 10117]